MQKLKRVLAMICCVAILGCGVVPAGASEQILNVEYITIDGDGFVADTLNGVPALYNRNGPTIYCVELIERYYREIFGLELNTAAMPPVVKNSDDYWFEVTDTPKTGDVLFGSAAARGKNYNHWALVKSYDAETGIITLIEQNWRWNGKAGVERQIAWPSGSYACYTLCTTTGDLVGNVPDADRSSEALREYLEKNAEYGLYATSDGFQKLVTAEQFCTMIVKAMEKLDCGDPAVYGQNRSACEKACQLGLVDTVWQESAVITGEQAAGVIGQVLAQADAAESDAMLELLDLESAPKTAITLEEALALTVIAYEAAESGVEDTAAMTAVVKACAAENLVASISDSLYLSRSADYYGVAK